MSFLDRIWRIPVLALAIALPLAVACADDDGALISQPPGVGTGAIAGQVTNAATGVGIVGALVGTSPATTTALTDANGNYRIENVAPGSYAVTASKEGFNSASTSVTVARDQTATANLALTPGAPDVPTTGDLNVLVTDRNGAPQSDASVTVVSSAGDTVATQATDANGFALFSDLAVGSYTVFASKTIGGFNFRAAGGVGIQGGETAFLQLTLTRDFDQSVFPNVDGEPVTLDGDADIEFVTVPGGDSNPEVDCNIIRTQHMFIVEVTNGDGEPVSGVKVQWDLNISENGTISVTCPELSPNPAGCTIPTVPGNTGSIVDSDDPDLDPTVARSGLAPAFNVDTRKAITFTNDGDQQVSFGGVQNVTVGAGQTWIIITSPVEGLTDVIAFTPDIPLVDPDCGLDDDAPCDKDFAIKRWVNWETRVHELDWVEDDGICNDPFNEACIDAGLSDFSAPIADGATVTNVLARADTLCVPINGTVAGAGAQCLLDNYTQFISVVERLRDDSPFNLSKGTMVWDITDDDPDVDFLGGTGGCNGVGTEPAGEGPPGRVRNAECNGSSDDEATVSANGNSSTIEFDANNNVFDGGLVGQFGLEDEDDFIGWGIVEVQLDTLQFFCVDVDGDGDCQPGDAGSLDTLSTAYQRLLAGTTDNTVSFRVRFVDDFGEVCDELTFSKEFVASRIQVIKSTPDATIRTVSETVGGPLIQPGSTARPVKTHTIQVGQSFSYTVTAINDGEVQAENVRITDTLPRFGFQFDDSGPDDGAPTMRNGSQAFKFVTDRPAFDPNAVVYAIDTDNDDPGDTIDLCIRGDDGSTGGNAYVEPAECTGITTDAGSIDAARAAAVDASDDGDQVVWIQWFDLTILGRQQPGGSIETEDSVEVTLAADEEFIDFDDAGPGTGYPPLPGTWCNISTVTDGPGNQGPAPLVTQSFDADTLCHEVREALLDIRKTTEDAVISAGAEAVFEIEIANAGSATLTNVVIVDTLDQAFIDADPTFSAADVELDPAFATATVTVNGRIITINIGNLPPTPGGGFVTVATIRVSTPGIESVFCNRVTVTGTNPAGTLSASDIACVTTTVTIELDIQNEDGSIDAGGVFQSAKEVFVVGDGGAARPDSLVYKVTITNQSQFAATNVVVVDQVAPNTGAIVCRAILATVPAGEPGGGGANPTVGSAGPAACATTGFTWNIGTLGAGQAAVIYFRAEALSPQSGVGNRVRLTADQLTGEIVNEEPTTVTAN
ncbi:MAG TPA: carboxypeptidase regulatory-like domain-containing protein [Gemmatimonadota bacterium]|nr:carboxypeptidase regulatory-like domain-containing protein [Gemmatimonadota bacterium]